MAGRRVVMVMVTVLDASDVERAPTGEPRISADSTDYTLLMASPATPDDGGWLTLETWRHGVPPQQNMALVPNLDFLAASVADAIGDLDR